MKLLPCSLASGVPSGAASYADQNEASPSLGAANCETVTAFVGSCEVSGVASHADQNAASPSVEAAICDTVATFVCCWRVQRSGDADQNQASPPLRAANGKTVATCGGVSGGASVVTSVADQNETSPSLRAANSETVATGVGSCRAQRHDVLRGSE